MEHFPLLHLVDPVGSGRLIRLPLENFFCSFAAAVPPLPSLTLLTLTYFGLIESSQVNECCVVELISCRRRRRRRGAAFEHVPISFGTEDLAELIHHSRKGKYVK